MTATYEAIATTTLGSAQSSVTFSSISGTYTDLVLVLNMATSSSSGSDSRYLVRINSDSGSNYSSSYLYGSGTSASSTRDTNRVQIDGVVNISSSPDFGQVIFQFQNYSNTSTYKTVLQRGGNLGNTSQIGVGAAVSLWRNTAAITALTILTGGPTPGNFVSGSTFTLYGIKAE